MSFQSSRILFNSLNYDDSWWDPALCRHSDSRADTCDGQSASWTLKAIVSPSSAIVDDDGDHEQYEYVHHDVCNYSQWLSMCAFVCFSQCVVVILKGRNVGAIALVLSASWHPPPKFYYSASCFCLISSCTTHGVLYTVHYVYSICFRGRLARSIDTLDVGKLCLE